MTEIGEWFAETTPEGTTALPSVTCRQPLDSAEDRERHVWQRVIAAIVSTNTLND